MEKSTFKKYLQKKTKNSNKFLVTRHEKSPKKLCKVKKIIKSPKNNY
jgi:hypothetical protein